MRVLNFSDHKCRQSENFSMADRLSKQHVILLVHLLTADAIPGHDKFIFTPRHELKNLGASHFCE